MVLGHGVYMHSVALIMCAHAGRT